MRRHTGVILFFAAALLIFLGKLFFLKYSFLYGDNYCQFYPWSLLYSEAVKKFTFPYWVTAMGCGFPLMAEGQVGGYYPLNIVIFFLLPFRAAYNYSIILHFIMGGVFTYAYSRKIGANGMGGALSALLFCFGSAYAGCFYNIISLRTLAWFPLGLLLIEYYLDRRALKYVFLLGIVQGFQLLAGFIQMAAYSAVFYAAYFAYRAFSERVKAADIARSAAIFLSTAFVIAVPQVLLTAKLASFSGREGAALGFALWRSFMPSGMLGMIFPYSLSSPHAHFYVGVLSLFFVIFCFFGIKKDPALKAVVMVLLLSLFFAIGWLNPLYVAFLKVTRFYFFRNPSKFLFFGAFALSVLAGCGFTKYFKSENKAEKGKAASIFVVTIACAASLFLAIKFLAVFLRRWILDAGYLFATRFVFGSPHHRHPLEYYTGKVDSLYSGILSAMSFSNIFVLLSWGLVILAVIMLPLILRKRMRYLCLLVISLDIFIFGFYGTGYSGNIKPLSFLEPENRRIYDILKRDAEPYRILPLGLKSEKLPNWSLPNANIIYNIDSVACYTPLAESSYRQRLTGLEVVDDSLGLNDSDEKAIGKNIQVLRMMNVRYVLSDRAMDDRSMEEVAADNGIFLYRLKGCFPRVFFSYGIDGGMGPVSCEDFNIRACRDGRMDLEFTAPGNGFVVFSENFYPGWRAYVDREEKELIRVTGFLQGVAVKKGKHRVSFLYNPYSFYCKR